MQLSAVCSQREKASTNDYLIKFGLSSQEDYLRKQQDYLRKQDSVAQVAKVEEQFQELKQQGYKVPRRLTKEDIARLSLQHRKTR